MPWSRVEELNIHTIYILCRERIRVFDGFDSHWSELPAGGKELKHVAVRVWGWVKVNWFCHQASSCVFPRSDLLPPTCHICNYWTSSSGWSIGSEHIVNRPIGLMGPSWDVQQCICKEHFIRMDWVFMQNLNTLFISLIATFCYTDPFPFKNAKWQ